MTANDKGFISNLMHYYFCLINKAVKEQESICKNNYGCSTFIVALIIIIALVFNKGININSNNTWNITTNPICEHSQDYQYKCTLQSINTNSQTKHTEIGRCTNTSKTSSTSTEELPRTTLKN